MPDCSSQKQSVVIPHQVPQSLFLGIAEIVFPLFDNHPVYAERSPNYSGRRLYLDVFLRAVPNQFRKPADGKPVLVLACLYLHKAEPDDSWPVRQEDLLHHILLLQLSYFVKTVFLPENIFLADDKFLQDFPCFPKSRNSSHPGPRAS